jgi:hypothetical protein
MKVNGYIAQQAAHRQRNSHRLRIWFSNVDDFTSFCWFTQKTDFLRGASESWINQRKKGYMLIVLHLTEWCISWISVCIYIVPTEGLHWLCSFAVIVYYPCH